MKNKSSYGNDRISNKCIKVLKEHLIEPLVYLINRSIGDGVFPDIYKHAMIRPLYKSKDKTSFDNYRPISLLRCMSKLLERIVNDRLVKFFDKNNLFDDRQYGFRKKRSTQDAINDVLGTILEKLNDNQSIYMVLIDLSKAFDVCNHQILKEKLQHYGIRGTMLEWFSTFLSDRKISVKIKDVESEQRIINLGTPQGGVISPTLFSIMINDLKNSLEYCENVMFADDTTLINGAHGAKVGYTQMKRDLQNVGDWFKVNKLLMNASKSNLIIFRNPKHKFNFDTALTIGHERITEVHTVKLLGVHIDNKLDWSPHCEDLKRKLAFAIFQLRSVNADLDIGVKREMYFAFFNTHMSYGISSWGSMLNSKQLRQLEVKQNDAIRAIMGVKRNKSVQHLYKKLKILPLRDLLKIRTI